MTENVFRIKGFDKNHNDMLSFIESVSSSNLETFHSKSIAWLLNSMESQNSWFKKFYKEFSDKKNDSIYHLGTISEFKNHDLITFLRVDGFYELVFWENKIKADFHQVKLSKTFKKNIDQKKIDKRKIDSYLSHWNRGISQPYYYLLRYYSKDDIKQEKWKKDIIEKIRELGIKEFNSTDINYTDIKLNWLILSPYHQIELETFHKEKWIGVKSFAKSKDTICGDKYLLDSTLIGQEATDWNFTTFEQLFFSLKFKDSKIVQNSYINYLKKENWFQTVNNLNVINNKVNDFQEWTVNFLLKVYKSIVENKDLSLEFKWKIKGSANTPHPLLNICFVRNNRTHLNSEEFKSILKYNSKNDAILVDRITCNIQLQGKNVKLQMSHWDYDNVILSSKNRAKDYSRIVTERITREKIIDDNLEKVVDHWLVSTDFEVKGKPNFPTTKTGLSFTLHEKSKGIRNKNQQIPTTNKILQLCLDINELLNNNN